MQDLRIFDVALIEKFRQRAAHKKTLGADFLLAHAAQDLAERLLTVDRHFSHAIDLHGHTGLGAKVLQSSSKVDRVLRVETDAIWLGNEKNGHITPREFLNLPKQSADLIISLLSLHLTNDTPGTLLQIRQTLQPDGLFLGVMAGSSTLFELRESLLQAENEIYGGVSPRVFPFTDVRDVGMLLQRAGFALPVSDVETVTVRYGTMFDLMRDLKNMGMQNALYARSRRPVSRAFFVRAAEIYAERFCDTDGRIRATFSLIGLSGWAPHQSQQQPARRGSGSVSLTDVLEKNKGES